MDTTVAKVAQSWTKNLAQKSKDLAGQTDNAMHEHAWKAVGLAAAIGLIIGLLIPSDG